MRDRVRVLRVIARMNVGGPAQQVTILSGRLDPARYETLLVAGQVGPGEASAAHLAAERGAHLVELDSLGPQIRPLADLPREIERALRPLDQQRVVVGAGRLGDPVRIDDASHDLVSLR